jgi:acyl carrier protein
MINTGTLLEDVKSVLVESLGIEDRADGIDASTQLFGCLPELDSLAVLELVTAIEERFEIVVDDSEFSGEIFETLHSLTAFVEDKLQIQGRS